MTTRIAGVDRLWEMVVSASEAARGTRNYDRRNALVDAFIAVTGDDREAVQERIDDAMIERHERAISRQG